MSRRAPLVAALLISAALGAASAAPSHFGTPPATPTVAVRAGIDGVGRPGRWLPVVVTVSGGDRAIEATLDVTWGESTVSQPIRLEAGGRAELTTTIRALDATPRVTATVTAGGARVAEGSLGLQLFDSDGHVVLCLGPREPECTVTLDANASTTRWRDLDVADEVRWTSVTPADEATARTLRLWRAMRWWNDSGIADPVLTPPDARVAGSSFPVALFAIMAVALALGALLVRRAHPAVALAMPLMVTGLATAAVARDRQPAHLDTTGIVRQFAGVDGAVITLRGEARHGDVPAIAAHPALAGLVDANVARRQDATRRQSAVDADGRAELRVAAPRDARTPFTLDATLVGGWLDAVGAANGLTLQNRSAMPLTGCRLRADTPRELGDIAAGGSIALGAVDPNSQALVECRLPSAWLTWESPAALDVSSTTWLVLHLWPGDGQAGTR